MEKQLADSNFYYTPLHLVKQEFASRGLLVLSPEDVGIDGKTHSSIFKREKELVDNGTPVRPSDIPDILDIINAPGVVSVCNSLLGINWAIVPFTHNASFTSGGNDQHWHKDDNGPYNGKKQRHHQAIQIEMLYYPQAVDEDMGPTATIPYSHYWSFDSEENQDNFAGAEHLDFSYQISGMERETISGPDSKYSRADIINKSTDHDKRMREAVSKTGWPLVKQLEAAPLQAGSVVFYSHNTFHRGNHRRDHWKDWKNKPRFMWRFWLYRTEEPHPDLDSPNEVDWNNLGIDKLTGIDYSTVNDNTTAIWNYHLNWLHSGIPVEKRKSSIDCLESLNQQLYSLGENAEPQRMGAAYKLAQTEHQNRSKEILKKALYSERESVRRAATHGLIAIGEAASDIFVEATKSSVKWLRKAGVYGLGDSGILNKISLNAIENRLNQDPSVFVRSVAASSLGCITRRAIGNKKGVEYIPAVCETFCDSLDREVNRLSMSKSQNRSIKFVRPTDFCDICEGDGTDLGQSRFKPVRSAVRENVLWSLVIICSHGIKYLGNTSDRIIKVLCEIIRSESNPICVGLAMDALTRLACLGKKTTSSNQLRAELESILKQSPLQPWESLIRAGLDPRKNAAS